ncbi:hypothetical protein OAV88_01430 [bacterium]|nr:hypothetical protein [bacterium]
MGIVGAAPVPGVTRAMSDGGLIGNGIGVLLSGLLQPTEPEGWEILLCGFSEFGNLAQNDWFSP